MIFFCNHIHTTFNSCIKKLSYPYKRYTYNYS